MREQQAELRLTLLVGVGLKSNNASKSPGDHKGPPYDQTCQAQFPSKPKYIDTINISGM